MSDDKGQHEPTMEEILASIRRIISEDDEPKARPAEPEPEPEAPPPPPPPKAAAPPPPPEPEPAPLEDIFELTKVVEDDGDIVDMAEPEPEPEPEPIPMAVEEDDLLVMEDEPEPEPEPVMAAPPPPPPPPRDFPPLPPVPDLALPEGLMGTNSAQNAAKALYVLQSGLPMYGPEGPRTLEVLVEDVLRPMLKAWLDDNLPPLVERLVQTEIDRLSRRGGRS